MRLASVMVAGCCAVVIWGTAVHAQVDPPQNPSAAGGALARLQADVPEVQVYRQDHRITRLYGSPMGGGLSPEETGQEFLANYAEALGTTADDLAPAGSLRDGTHIQPMMYDSHTTQYKFFLVRYSQHREGIPVFRSDLGLLVRNEPGFPLVLAASSLRDLGGFALDSSLAAVSLTPAAMDATGMTSFTEPEAVIWAGVDDMDVEPVLALTFVGESGSLEGRDYEKWLFVTDAVTGAVLYKENRIIHTDVVGTIRGMATSGPKSAECGPEVLTPMPYATASILGGNSAYADVNGQFTIPHAGTTQVDVESPMNGHYFVVDNVAGAEETIIRQVTPPGPVDIVHNVFNMTEEVRAQVNAYIQANIVRDFILAQNPTYPTIAGQTHFPVNVNRTDGYCPGNAWYDYSSINFCSSGGGYPNTAWSGIVHHEYGHHAVACGGSGQDQYGEGMSDCMAMLIADDPVMGYGFTGDCDSGIRTADNTLQYPCSGAIHYCGQLLSGCVWDTRQELEITNPGTGLDIVSELTVNSILLHSGGLITPQITIDFLTLDDDDGNIGNGTPHRTEICAGFGLHNMDCPAMSTGLSVIPATGLESEGPGGGPFTPDSKIYTLENLGPGAINYSVTATEPWLTITNGSGTLNNIGDTVDVTVSINANANALGDGLYSDTVDFINLTDHVGDTTREVSLAVGIPVVVHEWLLDTDPGWTTTDQWAFGTPTGSGSYNGDPTSGYTGSNVYGYNLYGDYTNNLPARYLTTTAFDCTGLFDVTLRFQRWLGVESNSNYDEATIEASNDGSTWTVLWRATDTGSAIADTSWQLQDVSLAAIADDQPTVYVRWGMGPTDGGTTYPGWNIDDVQIVAIGGTPPALSILFPGGVPEHLQPGVPTTFTVQIVNGGEDYVPGTGLLNYRYDGGTFLTSPLAPLGGNLYEATFPAPDCSATPEYYISAQGDGGSTVMNPSGAPGTVFTAAVGTFTTVISDNFETDQGWTAVNLGATSGDWQRGVPVDDPGWDYDPAADSDGSGQCYLTQNQIGNTDVDDGAVRLISPTLDLSSGGVTISYDYFLRLTDTGGGVDHLKVEIDGNDGAGPWTEIARHDTDGGLGWRHDVIDQADLNAAGVTLTSTMKLRFDTNDADPQSINESGLDAFSITSFVCLLHGDGDFDDDGDVDLKDFSSFQECFGQLAGPACEAGNMTGGDTMIDLADFDLFAAALSGP
ncbi:MAG: hypothetical protein JSV19_11205 [Phycisphaerales bacterium]|nr:MAG: hypothetical protein JSV19_11205 [Phycisphaerales bacterium]